MDLYTFGQKACGTILNTLYRPEIIGEENIPKDGPVLLCCNHISNLDPPLLGSFIERRISYMAKAELFDLPIFKTVLPKVGAFPIKRGMSDKQAMRTALSILKEGGMLGLFPEGTRSQTGELGKGLTGAGFFALRSEAVVIPSAIIGPYQRFKPLKVVYGPPLDFTEYRAQKRSAEEATEYIMNGINALIKQHKKST